MPRKIKDTDPLEIDYMVGKLLKERRSQRGLSQMNLAKMMDLSYQQIQKYERGDNRLSASRLLHISEILECTPNYFFGMDEIPYELDGSKEDRGRLALLKAYNSIKSPVRRVIVRTVANELSREED